MIFLLFGVIQAGATPRPTFERKTTMHFLRRCIPMVGVRDSRCWWNTGLSGFIFTVMTLCCGGVQLGACSSRVQNRDTARLCATAFSKVPAIGEDRWAGRCLGLPMHSGKFIVTSAMQLRGGSGKTAVTIEVMMCDRHFPYTILFQHMQWTIIDVCTISCTIFLHNHLCITSLSLQFDFTGDLQWNHAGCERLSTVEVMGTWDGWLNRHPLTYT